MMLQMILSLSVAFCVAVVVNGKIMYRQQTCESQEECPDNYCCSKRIFSDEAYCVAMRKENEVCLDDEMGTVMINGLYDITCPCAENMKCVKDEYMAPNGQIFNVGLPRCRRPGYSGFSPRTTRNLFRGSNNDLYASNNANALAQAEAEAN